MTENERESYTDRIKELEDELSYLQSDKDDIDDELDEKIELIKNLKAGVDVSKISVNQFCDVLDAVMDRLETDEIYRFDTASRLDGFFGYTEDQLDEAIYGK